MTLRPCPTERLTLNPAGQDGSNLKSRSPPEELREMKANGTAKTRSKAPLTIIPELEELQAKGKPIIVTINGKKKFAVTDAQTLEKLLVFVEWAETLEGVRESLREFEEGKGIPWEEAKAWLDKKYGISSRSRTARAARNRAGL